MEKVQSLDTLINRQKEVFDCYIKNNGREISLLPLLKKYSKEDGEEIEYSFEILMGYLKLYVASNKITPDELKKYNRVKKVPVSVVIERGREILNGLINSKGSLEYIDILAEKYSKEDGKVTPYTKEYLNKYRTYFINKNIDPNLIEQYSMVMELSKRTTTAGYDIELLNALLTYDENKAVDFLRKINISKTSLNSLKNVYAILYPANKKELEFLDSVINEAFKPTAEYHSIFAPSPLKKKNLRPRQDRLKDLLEAYLMRDTKDITKLLKEFDMSVYSFKEALKDAKTSNDPVLLTLLDRYNVKEESILAEAKEILDTLIEKRQNGINYGNGFRKFESFDLYCIVDSGFDNLGKTAYKLYNRSTAQMLENYLTSLTLSRIYDTPQELLDATNISYNGKSLTDEDKYLILSFMKTMAWPYSAKLFTSAARRYLDGDFVIEIENLEENDAQVNKLPG